MTVTPPPVGPNLQKWATATRAYLQRWMPRLQWKTQDSNPSENGIMLWDEENKTPIVSFDNDWRRLTMSEVIFVQGPEDFPDPVAGVITLPDNTVYSLCGTVDLLGDRIVAGRNTVIVGQSTSTCTLQSTGLTGTALITSNYTITFRHITLTADVALDLDGSTGEAIDWLAVNFTDCPTVGTIKNYDNAIFINLGVLNSANWTFDGTIGTVAFDNTILSGRASQKTIIIPSTMVFTRRFRINFSAIVTPSGGTGIDFSTSATVPVESYILFECNFGGAGTAIAGVTNTDNKALFSGNIGVPDTSEISNYYMNGNATATTIGVAGVAVKVAGTTTSGSLTQKFSNAVTNRAEYTGAVTRTFQIDVLAAVTSGNNKVIALYVAENGTTQPQSVGRATTNAGGRAESMASSGVFELVTNDYLEVWVANETDTTSVTVEDLHVLVTEV